MVSKDAMQAAMGETHPIALISVLIFHMSFNMQSFPEVQRVQQPHWSVLQARQW